MKRNGRDFQKKEEEEEEEEEGREGKGGREEDPPAFSGASHPLLESFHILILMEWWDGWRFFF